MLEDNGRKDSIFRLKDMLCTASKLVCDAPCWLYSVIFNGDSHAYSEFALRDGFDSTDDAKIQCQIGQYTVEPLRFKPPVRFKQGLYVDFVSDGYTAFVQYLPDY